LPHRGPGLARRTTSPQAFTHLALINAVTHVIADERRADEEGTGKTAVFTEMRGGSG